MSEPTKQPDGRKEAKLVEYRVCVRHSPLIYAHKRRVLKATSKEDAWQQFLKEVEPLITERTYFDGTRPRRLFHQTVEWMKNAKVGGIPRDTEIITEAYAKARIEALRVRAPAIVMPTEETVPA